MFLSRIQLTKAIGGYSQLGKLLQDNSYGMHRLLWDLFDESGERFLFREEQSREQLGTEYNAPLYYVLSRQQPKTDNPLFDVQSKAFSPVLASGDKLGFRLRANPVVTEKRERDNPEAFLRERAKRDVENKDKLTKKRVRHDVVMNAQKQWLLSACADRDITLSSTRKSEMKRALLSHDEYSGNEGESRLHTQLDYVVNNATSEWLSEKGQRHGFSIQSLQTTGYQWRALPEKGRGAGFSSVDYEGALVVDDPEAFKECLLNGIGPAKAFGCGLFLIRRI